MMRCTVSRVVHARGGATHEVSDPLREHFLKGYKEASFLGGGVIYTVITTAPSPALVRRLPVPSFY
jgi:hypothetical protein